ncbi:MAG: hypothetical protein JWP27_531 [Flaviaesturariibacter sp.]|nr:hypothetical protein [Flaviaesturariibacter sp.]
MSMLIYLFLAYLLYQLIFRFIVPIWRATRQVKKGFRDMQERMNTGAAPEEPAQAGGSSRAVAKGDYIDFEEVKD